MLADYLTFTQVVEVISLITVVLIAGYSFRTYILTQQRKHEYFALAFVFLAIGIALAILFNAQVRLDQIPINFHGRVPLTDAAGILLFAAIFFRMAGYMTIFLVTEDITSWKMVALSFIFVALVSLLGLDYYPIFHITNFIILALVFIHFYNNFHVHSSTSSLLVMLAFAFLALSQIPFTLVFVDRLFYDIGAVIRLLSFILFLSALIIIFKPRRSTSHARA